MKSQWVKSRSMKNLSKSEQTRADALGEAYDRVKCMVWGHQLNETTLKCECGEAQTFITHG